MANQQFTDIGACVFDAYGTLFDVHSAAARCRDDLGEKADAVSQTWRVRQLEYTWLRSLMGRHADFWRVTGDALDYATRFEEIAFCFSDIEPPELNAKVYEKVVPHLVPGGWLVIDNMTSPRVMTDLLNRARNDTRVDCVLLPFPKGDLVCRKC